MSWSSTVSVIDLKLRCIVHLRNAKSKWRKDRCWNPCMQTACLFFNVFFKIFLKKLKYIFWSSFFISQEHIPIKILSKKIFTNTLKNHPHQQNSLHFDTSFSVHYSIFLRGSEWQSQDFFVGANLLWIIQLYI